MENQLSQINFKCINGASLYAGTASANGILLGPKDLLGDGGVSYSLKISDLVGFSFLFGFRGNGCHYRCDIQPLRGILALYQMRDGIPLYLHHICTRFPLGSIIRITWHAHSIRIQLGSFTILNVVVDGWTSGHWGFAALNGPFKVPALTRKPVTSEKYEWICLGDGFSNARWRNRHFLSWPEILWGEGNTCLNACVAAANSSRVLEVLSDLKAHIKDANVIIATGSDDLIEGEAFNDYSTRLHQIVSELQKAGAVGIHLCTLPPRKSDLLNTRVWSMHIKDFANNHNLPALDFHDWILPEMATCMVRGEYPGATAQQLIAQKIAENFSLKTAGACPNTFEPRYPFRGKLNAMTHKAKGLLEEFYQDFPGLVR